MNFFPGLRGTSFVSLEVIAALGWTNGSTDVGKVPIYKRDQRHLGFYGFN